MNTNGCWTVIFLSVLTWRVHADATLLLNNYDSMNPIYYGSVGQLSPQESTWVQIFAANSDSYDFSPLSDPFKLKEDGFFDNGYGTVIGVPDGSSINIRILAWIGSDQVEDAQTLLEGIIRQKGGSGSSAPAMLQFPMDALIPIPEPRIALFVLLGGLLLAGVEKLRKRR
ncbi:MAG TPA: hypothetical protein P5186_19805 [Candidatus Paceibacterota bacterium]|nr:hypothetical protein [Verrucomicrobiota bacterium]HRY50304.1 hypothetical protein [Candidatus Paceibacterota bacterium]